MQSFLNRHAIGSFTGMETMMQTDIDMMLSSIEPVLEKAAVADILQNDVSQTLAAVLLMLQSALEDEQHAGDQRLQLAETNLKASIKKLVRLHYELLK